MSTNLQKHKFSVYVILADGRSTVCIRDVSSEQAAGTFWHLSNTYSARSGVTQRVIIVDGADNTVLAWQYGRGYTYDGETWTDKPIIPTETRDYGKN